MNHILDTVTRICSLPIDDGKRKKHTFYQMNAKVGTVPALVWYVDKIPEVGDWCYFYDELGQQRVSPKLKNFNMICDNGFQSGFCDRKNDDGYCFIKKG